MLLRILVTGANGQLGQEIFQIGRFKKEYEIFYTDKDQLDISDVESLEESFETLNPNFVINCAAYTNVDGAETEIDEAFRINSLSVANLSTICRKHEIPIIHISTDYVFDGLNFRPYNENDKTNPLNIYGKSKLEGEQYLYEYEKTIIIRTSWLYSSFGNNFVKTIIQKAKEQPLLRVVYDQIGTPTYAQDLAVAIFSIIDHYYNTKELWNGIYHFSNEGVCSWYDFAYEIIKQQNLKCEIEPIQSELLPRPAKRPFYSVLDKTKIKNTYSLKIAHWTDSLQKCLFLLSKNTHN